ncbi:hypothetical protein QA601_04640 [Chitinispirillales bacterium ANBcel5]|uniref:hypothetical protein n=1 Tax=Cellulosispirillum alkaliphilum TaxID=3039283 RepID=UPI002A578783|nr:hypothetical protein [Chitinispirillales bacterium ANBcel5]
MSEIKSKKKKLVNIVACSGGIWFRVFLLFLTLGFVWGSISFVIDTVTVHQEQNYRRAVIISEYGLQKALQQLGTNPSWREGFKKSRYSESAKGWYEVNLDQVVKEDSLLVKIESIGGVGTSQSVKRWVLGLLVENGDSSWVPVKIH